MILAGDTGGTKTVLALFDRGAIAREQVYACADYSSLEAILDEFLGASAPQPAPIDAACFGIAGPVVGERATVTNLPWTIDARELSARLGGAPVALLNDLQATALGTLVLPDDAFAVLQAPAAPPPPGAAIGVIAPGTGLGQAMLISEARGYRALPTEAGHADFAPSTDDELALLRFLRGRSGGHVSWEHVLSGDGIGAMYDFLRGDAPEPDWSGDDRNAEIAAAGLAGTDPAAVGALAMFAALLGAEAGNLALRAFALGGVAIGGGIPPKLLPALQTGATVARFNAKGRFEPWLRAIGLRVVLEPRAALFGAAHHASPWRRV